MKKALEVAYSATLASVENCPAATSPLVAGRGRTDASTLWSLAWLAAILEALVEAVADTAADKRTGDGRR